MDRVAGTKTAGPVTAGRGTGVLLLIMALGLLLFTGSGPISTVLAQGISEAPPAAKPKAREKRVIILGTTVVGNIAKPRAVYEVPWKDPESLKKGLDEPQRSFHREIFKLLDREEFEMEIGTTP